MNEKKRQMRKEGKKLVAKVKPQQTATALGGRGWSWGREGAPASKLPIFTVGSFRSVSFLSEGSILDSCYNEV